MAENSDPSRQTLRQQIFAGLMFIESHIIQLVYVLFIVQAVFYLAAAGADGGKLLGVLGQRAWNVAELTFLANVCFVWALLFFDLMVVYSLYTRRNLREMPRDWREVVFPTLGTFGMVFYNLVALVWPLNSPRLMPPDWLPVSLLAGAALSLFGISLGVWAIMYLRRSFGIFVQVRDVVLGGPYAWVRHPMYLGHIFIDIGFFLLNPTLVILFVSAGMIALTVYRARLEEARLSCASAEYLAYRQATPFLFPFRFASRREN